MRWLIRRMLLLRVRPVGRDHAELPAAAADARRPRRRGAAAAELGADRVEPGPDPDVPRSARRRPRSRCCSAYLGYLHRVVTLNFGISTSNYPTRVSDGDRQHAAVLDLPGRRRLHPRLRPRHHGRHDRGLAPRRRRRQHRRADAALDQRVPRLLHVARRRLHLGLKLGWFPLAHAYDTEPRARASTTRSSRAPSATRSCRSS